MFKDTCKTKLKFSNIGKIYINFISFEGQENLKVVGIFNENSLVKSMELNCNEDGDKIRVSLLDRCSIFPQHSLFMLGKAYDMKIIIKCIMGNKT